MTVSSTTTQPTAPTAATPAPARKVFPGPVWLGHFRKAFATGADQPIQKTQEEIDRAFRRKRIAIMLSITLGYGIAYTCRLGLAVVKKPLKK